MKPTVFLACAAALAAIAGCNSNQGNAATGAAATVKVSPPRNGDWTTIVVPTAAGGFLMGNPNAKVKLIEYGSLTCPHCREFDETGVTPLINGYVKPGKVAYEFRNYVRDGFDLTASLIARCNGAKSFFPLARALYKDQPTWVGKIQKVPPAQIEALQNLPPNKEFIELAKVMGLQQYAAVRGVPIAKSTQCLANSNSVNQLVQMTSDATTQFPDFPGTPTFIINGKMLDRVASWKDLEGKLKSALGG
ncbi:MAG: thioredoxin domain-containing protein [Pseudomonadota bacterium]|nr:thioredoxin domain-containing protein [Pseudomonadota bacterium]